MWWYVKHTLRSYSMKVKLFALLIMFLLLTCNSLYCMLQVQLTLMTSRNSLYADC